MRWLRSSILFFNMNKDTSKSTVLVITVGFLALHLVFGWEWAAMTALIIGLAGAISSFLAELIETIWMKLSGILSHIIPNILLTLMFYLFLTPLALIYRIFNKDSLKLSDKYDSYFIDTDRKFNRDYFTKTW